ncbi:MAG: PEGA domain-containing protein [Ktedonobacterales bacterium]
MGKYRDAAEHLDYALREAPADKRVALREQAQGMLNEARAKVGALRIGVSVPGAEVLVGGKVIGKAPLRAAVYVEPGPVVVEARLDGYAGAREARTAGAGVEEHIDLVLSKEGLAPVSKMRTVDMGTYQGPNKGILIAGTGVGAAFVIAGVGLLVASNSSAARSHDLEQIHVTCGNEDPLCKTSFTGLQQDKVTFGRLSIASFIVGGAMLVGTWTYGGAALAMKPRPEPSMHADVAVSSGRAVGTLTFRW